VKRGRTSEKRKGLRGRIRCSGGGGMNE